jgi:hypothetical protein
MHHTSTSDRTPARSKEDDEASGRFPSTTSRRNGRPTREERLCWRERLSHSSFVALSTRSSSGWGGLGGRGRAEDERTKKQKWLSEESRGACCALYPSRRLPRVSLLRVSPTSAGRRSAGTETSRGGRKSEVERRCSASWNASTTVTSFPASNQPTLASTATPGGSFDRPSTAGSLPFVVFLNSFLGMSSLRRRRIESRAALSYLVRSPRALFPSSSLAEKGVTSRQPLPPSFSSQASRPKVDPRTPSFT